MTVQPTNQNVAILTAQLTSERDALLAFIKLLETEQQAISSQDSEQLFVLSETKIQAVSQLTEQSNQRRKLMGSPPSSLDTSAWIAQNIPACSALWNEIRELAARANHLNHVNGEVIQLRLRSNQQALAALLGASQSAAGLYGRDGQTSLPKSGRTLGSV